MEISPYNLTWRRYKLDTTPYFQNPLSLDEENRNVPITTFIGRAEERRKLKNIIQLGGDRCIVHGQAGVGKTTLVNYIRYEAKEGDFFTTLNEIEINRVMSANEFIILTLSQIYDQLKHENFPVTGDLAEKLKMLYELNQQAEFQGGLTQVTQLNRNTLLSLFKQIVRELIPKYKGLVLHYDNFDNIEDTKGIGDMLGELRDFFLTPNVTFIFVGGTFFPSAVMQKKQVSQIIGQEILVEPLNLHEVNAILDSRIAALKIDVTAVKPHTPEAVKILFELYDGNLRDILRSLNTCVIELPKTNTPIQITADVLKDTLYKKVDREFLTRLTPTDKEILAKILDKDRFTPSELAALSKRPIQNISSKYLKKFVTINAVKYIGAEGRNRYYVASHELKWWKFGEQRTSPKQPKSEVDKRLMEFFS